jgi:CxxC motif-containing protein (DUF1111 family)
MRLRTVLVFITVLLGGCAAPADEDGGWSLVVEDRADVPISDLPAGLAVRFGRGEAAFDGRFFAAQGLGPLYIRAACVSCHADDGRGPGVVQRFVVVDATGAIVEPPHGDVVRPFVAAGATQPVQPPPAVDGGTVVTSTRLPPAVFARGFIEAVDDDAIVAGERAQAARSDGISGRVHRVAWRAGPNPDPRVHDHGEGDVGLIGRFGLKARTATLDEFTADALRGDMGLTSPLHPTELPNPDGLDDDDKPGVDVDVNVVNDLADYARLLALPARPVSVDDDDGARLFAVARCDVCHTPRLRTRADHPYAPLADQDAPIFSDLLLHDMGDGLADGVVEGDASGREWRSAPLIGLRFFSALLHDGRASSVRDAIEQHEGNGSEANDSIARFRAFTPDEQDAVVRFVEAL